MACLRLLRSLAWRVGLGLVERASLSPALRVGLRLELDGEVNGDTGPRVGFDISLQLTGLPFGFDVEGYIVHAGFDHILK